MVIFLTIFELVYFETFPMDFVCQSYITAVVIPHTLYWLSMQIYRTPFTGWIMCTKMNHLCSFKSKLFDELNWNRVRYSFQQLLPFSNVSIFPQTSFWSFLTGHYLYHRQNKLDTTRDLTHRIQLFVCVCVWHRFFSKRTLYSRFQALKYYSRMNQPTLKNIYWCEWLRNTAESHTNEQQVGKHFRLVVKLSNKSHV
jgi:hypothetical protein